MSVRLITSPATQVEFTGVQETDARGALVRGLKEYLELIEYEPPGGRLIRFQKVHAEMAEPEQTVKYPLAVVYADGQGTYAGTRLGSDAFSAENRLPHPDGRYVVSAAEYTQSLIVEVVANDKQERMGLMMLLEAAFTPVDWLFGVRLSLPHYFGQHAEFSLGGVQYPDTTDEAQQRIRRILLTVQATVPFTRVVAKPGARPLFELRAVSDNPTVLSDVTTS